MTLDSAETPFAKTPFSSFPIFSGKLSGLFLVGALNRPRKRKRTNRENPRTIPEQIGKIPDKSGKDKKGQKKEGQVQIGKPPRLKHPRLAGLDICLVFIGYRASIAEIPFSGGGGGGITPPLRMLSKGETLRKAAGGIAPNGPC